MLPFSPTVCADNQFTDPSDSVDKFAGQLEQSVVEVLDELAPLKTCSNVVAGGPVAGCLNQPWLPSGNDVVWSDGGTGLVAMRIVLRTDRRVARPVLRSTSQDSHSISNDSPKPPTLKELSGKLYVSCSTQTMIMP